MGWKKHANNLAGAALALGGARVLRGKILDEDIVFDGSIRVGDWALTGMVLPKPGNGGSVMFTRACGTPFEVEFRMEAPMWKNDLFGNMGPAIHVDPGFPHAAPLGRGRRVVFWFYPRRIGSCSAHVMDMPDGWPDSGAIFTRFRVPKTGRLKWDYCGAEPRSRRTLARARGYCRQYLRLLSGFVAEANPDAFPFGCHPLLRSMLCAAKKNLSGR